LAPLSGLAFLVPSSLSSKQQKKLEAKKQSCRNGRKQEGGVEKRNHTLTYSIPFRNEAFEHAFEMKSNSASSMVNLPRKIVILKRMTATTMGT